MIPLLDAALLGVTLATALYCAVLSRRLRQLHDLKRGIGGAIVGMTKAAGAVRQETTALSARTAAAADRLETLLSRIDECQPKVDLLLETMDRQARETWRENKSRIDATRTEVTALASDMRVLIELMNEQVLQAAEAPARPAAQHASRPALSPVAPPPGAPSNVVRVGTPKAAPRPNPFAQRVAVGE